MMPAAARTTPAVPLYSTAAVSSAIPDSMPDAAVHSSLVRGSVPACSDESAVVADLFLPAKASKSAETASPQAISTAVWHPVGHASVDDHRWREFSLRLPPTTHVLNGSLTL